MEAELLETASDPTWSLVRGQAFEVPVPVPVGVRGWEGGGGGGGG